MEKLIKKKMNYYRIWLKNVSVRKREDPPPTNKKLEKILQDLLWDVFKKHFFEKVVMDTLPPKKF